MSTTVTVHGPIAEVAEYLISSPTGFRTSSGWFHRLFKELKTSATADLIDSLGEDAEKLVRLSADAVQSLKAAGLVVERNVTYRHDRHPVLDRFQQVALSDSGTKQRINMRVMDHDTRDPISNVEVYLILDVPTMSGFRAITNAGGECEVIVPGAISRFPMVTFVPAKDYWSLRLEQIGVKELSSVKLKPLPPSTPEVYDWGHGFSAMVDGAANGGRQVTIGIIDTGVRSDHPDLSPAGGLNCVLGQDPSEWHDDRDGHGSHCAGVIAALMNEFGIKMDGTSMACPHIAGIGALALASHAEILQARRDADRVERLLQLLRRAARPLGFGPEYEGSGFPSVKQILSM